jgi:hypothetical protein
VTVTDFLVIMGQTLLYLVDGAVGDRAISRGGTQIAEISIRSLTPLIYCWVRVSLSGQFISGWKLNPAKLQNVLEHGG